MVISRGVAQKEATANRIVANRYLLSKKLGQGQYGTVYLVEDDQSLYTEEKFKVLKEIHVGEMPPDETIDAMREAKLQAKLDHIGVVKCFNNFLDKDFFCIISEYCNGGDLGLLIEKAKKEGTHFSEVEILDYFCQVVLATRYMHQKQILHRDLKPRNIFVKDNTCKLGDFGISRVLMGTADMASTFIGTPYYMSPECLRHEGYDSKSDMWSLGVILYELCTFEHCFDGESMMAVMYKITQGKIPKLPEHFSKGIQNIYEKLVNRNQKKRYSAAQVLRDTFISNHLQKMKKRVSEEWVHAIEIAKNILDQEPSLPNNTNDTVHRTNYEQELSVEVPPGAEVTPEGFIVSSQLQDYMGGVDEGTLGAGDDGQDETLVARTVVKQEGGAEVKTAAELAAERKKQKQLEEELLIREATKNTWLENYKHRDNVKRLYHSQDAATSIAMQPHSRAVGSKRFPATLPESSSKQPPHLSQKPGVTSMATSGQYEGPVMPKPTRIPSPDSLAVKRVGTTQGERKPLNNLKASFSSSSPEEKDRSKRTEQDEDSGFSSVSASNDSNSAQQHNMQDTWNNRPISAKNRMFEEILEEELRKSSEVVEEGAVGYTPSGMIPKKPFVPLKKGTGKMAYNSNNNKQKNQRRRKAKKKRGRGDEADGAEDFEFDYEDDFEDYIASDPEQYDDQQVDSDDNPEDAYDGEIEGLGDMSIGGGAAGGRVNPENQPLVFVDVYSPSIKAKKIANMRSECVRKMGEKNFNKVYNYLQTARRKTSNEIEIFQELNRLHSVHDDNFLVDQLIFLEATS